MRTPINKALLIETRVRERAQIKFADPSYDGPATLLRQAYGGQASADPTKARKPPALRRPYLHQQILRLDRVAERDVQFADHAVAGRVHRVLHFHRLHHEELLAFADLRSDGDLELCDEAGDW